MVYLTKRWSIIYERAIREDGSLFFPERLSHEFLENARKTMGTYLFANQYQNEIMPTDVAPFKPWWYRCYNTIPDGTHCFAFIDPAISTEDGADFTGIVVVHVAYDGTWYVSLAVRERLTPTQIVEKIFALNKMYQPLVIGIEDVAYQKALLYMIDEEMRRRGTVVPAKGIRPDTQKSKETRILGLVPRFEWGRIFINQGMHDFELEYLQFPRSSHDDIIDALAHIEQIAFTPTVKKEEIHEMAPNHPEYERKFIENRFREANGRGDTHADYDDYG